MSNEKELEGYKKAFPDYYNTVHRVVLELKPMDKNEEIELELDSMKTYAAGYEKCKK